MRVDINRYLFQVCNLLQKHKITRIYKRKNGCVPIIFKKNHIMT